MKKKYDRITVYKSNEIDDILPNVKCEMPFPFTRQMLILCKRENPNRQEYYYIEREDSYAFFVLYYDRINIFSLGKREFFMNMKTVGYPCSLSDCGYITNDLTFLIEFVKKIKGTKLILNVKEPVDARNIVFGETLPTCMFNIDFSDMSEYMASMRSSYRRRIVIALKKCGDMRIEKVQSDTRADDIHRLYLNTYERSQYKLERLEKGFFEKIDAVKLVFFRDDIPMGFVLLKKDKEKLVFMLCGMDYDYPTADLYYFMLYNIIKYALENRCTVIDFGQTSEHTKMKFGAFLEKRYFYAFHTNILINMLAKKAKPLLEYRYDFPEYRVKKDGGR